MPPGAPDSVVFRDREAVLKAVKAELQPHYSQQRLTREEFAALAKASLQWVLDAQPGSDAWTPSGLALHVQARVSRLLGGAAAQDAWEERPAAHGTVDAHRQALASIKGHMVRHLDRNDTALRLTTNVALRPLPNDTESDGEDGDGYPQTSLTGPSSSSTPTAASRRGTPRSVAPAYMQHHSVAADEPSALSPPFRPRRSPSAGRANTPRATASGFHATVVHVPPPAAATSLSAASYNTERLVPQPLSLPPGAAELLGLRELAQRQGIELDETRAWQGDVVVPFVTAAAGLMVRAAMRAAAAAPAALAPRPQSRPPTPPPPPLPAESVREQSAVPSFRDPSVSSEQAPHQHQQQNVPPPRQQQQQPAAVEALYEQLQAKQRALREALIAGNTTTPSSPPRNRAGPPEPTAAVLMSPTRHYYSAAPSAAPHPRPAALPPQGLVSPARHASMPRPTSPSATTPRRATMGHRSPARPLTGVPAAVVGSSRPSRPQVVDFMRQVLQPHYNDGRLPQSAFVAIVKSVSADFFSDAHDWRSGSVANDRVWQAYLDERLQLCVERLDMRRGPPPAATR